MKPEDDAGQSLQRVKVGLTGLAVVLLLIALASGISRSAQHARPPAAARPDVVANLAATNDSDPAGEPLAQIGVAPAEQPDPLPGNASAARR